MEYYYKDMRQSESLHQHYSETFNAHDEEGFAVVLDVTLFTSSVGASDIRLKFIHAAVFHNSTK